MATVRTFKELLRDKEIGHRIVPIIPDEARTFGMDSWFPSLKIYNRNGQLYTSVDAELMLAYKESPIGQILHENRRFDDVVEAQAGLVQDGLQIFEGLVGLGLHAIGQIAGGGIQAELAAAIGDGAGVNGLRIGAEGGGGVRGGNVGHSDALLYV